MAKDIWSHVCASSQHLYALIVLLFILFILNIYALVFGEPGTISHTVAQLDLILLVVAFAITTLVYWKCVERERSDT